MAKDTRKRVVVYLDGKEVETTIPNIKRKIRELTREMNNSELGTEKYNQTVRDISELNGVLCRKKVIFVLTNKNVFVYL